MSAVNNLLDKYAARCAIKTDSALGQSLHVSRQAVHQWRKGTSWPTEEHVIKMAHAIGERPEQWFLHISADRATPAARAIWQRLIQLAACLVGAYLFSRLNVQTDSLAALLLAARNPGTMYIMSTLILVGMALAWHTRKHGQRQCLDTIPA